MLIDVDKMVIGGFMTELENLGNSMQIAAQQYNEALRLIDDPGSANQNELISRILFAGQSILSVAALVSKVLIPPPKRPNGCKCALTPEQESDYQRIKHRCKTLRKALGIKGDLPREINSRSVRNHFEHFDTRLDEYYAAHSHEDFRQRVVAPSDVYPTALAMRHLDYEQHTISVFGETVSLAATRDAVFDIAGRAQRWVKEEID